VYNTQHFQPPTSLGAASFLKQPFVAGTTIVIPGGFRNTNIVAPGSQPNQYAMQQQQQYQGPVLQQHAVQTTNASTPTSNVAARDQPVHAGPYPFASMTHAAQSMLEVSSVLHSNPPSQQNAVGAALAHPSAGLLPVSPASSYPLPSAFHPQHHP